MTAYKFNDVGAINLAIEETLNEGDVNIGFCEVQNNLFIAGVKHSWDFLHDYLKKDGRIILYSDNVPKNINLDENINIRRREVLGYRLAGLKDFTRELEKQGGRISLLFPAERGDVFGIKSDRSYVLKPVIDGIEASIIKITSNLEIAPPLIIINTESYVELYGPPLEPKDHPHLDVPPLARKFKLLHSNGIAYNERLTEHLVKIDDDQKLIDYGEARFSNDFSLDFKKIQEFFGNRYELFLKEYDKI
ncbi:MAG: hypothetical protein ACP5N3_05000 [Candidatus Nanoarchaeia archaeon]